METMKNMREQLIAEVFEAYENALEQGERFDFARYNVIPEEIQKIQSVARAGFLLLRQVSREEFEKMVQRSLGCVLDKVTQGHSCTI